MPEQIVKKKIYFFLLAFVFVILLGILGFQLWIIRSQGYEIVSLRNESISNQAEAEDMRRKLVEVASGFNKRTQNISSGKVQEPRFFSEGLAKHYRAEYEEFVSMLENDEYITSIILLQAFYKKRIAKVIYADEMIVSYRLETESYTGGAHENRLIYVGTIARLASTNRETPHLHLIDIVNDEQMPELRKRLIQALKDESARRGSPEEANRILDSVAPLENFYYDKDGLHFFYNEYDIDCFGAGTFDICIDWPLPDFVTAWFTTAE